MDHLVPHKGDKKLFEQVGNHIPLCTICHNKVTARFDSRYVVGSSIEKKTQWLNDERLKNETLSGAKFSSVKVIQYEE